jgi:3-oxoacyl-[acyl-carrier protein] reductase
MSQDDAARTAVIIGAARPFGAEIVERLGAEGYAVTAVPEGTAGAALEVDAPLDLFVLNAPVRPAGTRFRDITDDEFLSAVQEQLYELVAAGQAAARRMTKGGSIVHVASRAHLGAWGGAHQMAAGAALVGMSRSMSLELAAQGIRVNVLAPDFVGETWDTPAARAEVAGAVAFLAGPDSRLMTGETLLLDGGKSLRMTEGAKR